VFSGRHPSQSVMQMLELPRPDSGEEAPSSPVARSARSHSSWACSRRRCTASTATRHRTSPPRTRSRPPSERQRGGHSGGAPGP
jgi:hypothetical protein